MNISKQSFFSDGIAQGARLWFFCMSKILSRRKSAKIFKNLELQFKRKFKMDFYIYFFFRCYSKLYFYRHTHVFFSITHSLQRYFRKTLDVVIRVSAATFPRPGGKPAQNSGHCRIAGNRKPHLQELEQDCNCRFTILPYKLLKALRFSVRAEI